MANQNRNGWLWAALGAGAFLTARTIIRKTRAYNFNNKVVLITGASRGLGLVLARQFADEGARLAICARNTQELEQARQELAGRGAEVLAIPCDVTDRNQVHGMINQVREQFGAVDVLINNAGFIAVGPVETMTIKEYEEAMNTHFWAPLYTMLSVTPHMKERKAGRIVNISSVGGKVSLPHQIPYSASKFALVGLSEGMRAELKKDNVFVTTANPGLTRTGSPRNVTVKGQHEQEYAWFKVADSLPFLTMSAEQTARQIIDAARYGDGELTLTVPGKIAAGFHALFPGATADIFGAINQLLPATAGIGSMERKKGYESEGEAPASLTVLTDEAAAKNNE